MKHRVLILGIDGYLGWPLALHLLNKDYEVCGLDNLSRRRLVSTIGSNSLTPIQDFPQREAFLKHNKNFIDNIACINLEDPYLISRVLCEFMPDTIVHLAEQPSAPYSMKDVRSCIDTQISNVSGTLALLWAIREHCPDVHLIKLGTMGEYGTPNCDIPEGTIPNKCIHGFEPGIWQEGVIDCPMSGLPFPRSPNSFYHLSKVHDTHNIIFACKTWNLRSTDIMQGVVFGVSINNDVDINTLTRFDYDQYFGTVINRFITQSLINHPLTIYGEGNQLRGYIPLQDSIQCLNIAIDNPPKQGEYRTFNQFKNVYSINELACAVISTAKLLGYKSPLINHIPNPRTENENNYYNPMHQKLYALGYRPSNMHDELIKLFNDLIPFIHRINSNVIMPTIKWR